MANFLAPSRTVARTGLPASARAAMVLGAALILAIQLLTGYEIWRQRATTVRAAEQQIRAVSLGVASQTERTLQAVDLVLQATRQSVTAAGGLGGTLTEDFHTKLAERTVGLPAIKGLGLVTPAGVIVNTSRLWPPPERKMIDDEYVERHRATSADVLLINPPQRSPVDDQWVIPVTRRLSGPDGSFQGVVVAALDIDYLHAQFSRVLPEEGGAIGVYRTDGVMLMRHPQVDEAMGKTFTNLPLFAEHLPRAPQGTFRNASAFDDTVRLFSYHRLELFPVVVNVSMDENRLLEPWRGNAVRLALGAVVATLVLAVAVWHMVRQLNRHGRQADALKESEERLRFARFALDHAGDMVFWIDRGGRILYANIAARSRLGYEPGEIPSLSIADIDPSQHREAWAAMFDRLVAEGATRTQSFQRTRDGQLFPIEVTATHVEFEGEHYVCAFGRDISERRRNEAVLAENTLRLEASNAELEQFAYVASHDLREPLRMVNSFVTMLARRYGDKLDAEGREFISYAQEGATRMDRLILDLLEYSRVGREDRTLAPVPLGQAVQLAVRGLGVAMMEAAAELDIAADLPMVEANEEELVRLFLNLIGNAIKYRDPVRPLLVRIGAERHGDSVKVWVADNGIGIAEQYHERIFRIFQRLHNRERYEGTGIGLAICKKIVEHLGGRIWLDSTPDEGTTFYLTLRAARAEQQPAPQILADHPAPL